MPPRPARPTTLNQLGEDDDDDHSDHADSIHHSEGGAGGAGGKEKTPSQARKNQNKIAQREFRQRKQQYIRDLEARVEVLSGDKEERIELVMLLVKNLLQENKELRGMIKSMAGFVSEGLGSCLPRLGLSAPQLDAILNRADTDTAYEAFVKLRASRELEEANPGIPFGEIKRKTTATKRKRGSSHAATEAGPSSAGADPNIDPATLNDTPGAKFSRTDPGRQAPELDTNANYADTYSYLFPETSGNADWSQFQGQRGDMPYPGSPLGQVRDGNMPYNAYTQEQQAQAIRGMFPLGGPMYSQPQPAWGPFGAISGDLSGFGLTLPPGPGQSMSSLAGPSRPVNEANYAATHPPAALAQSGGGSGKASATPDLSARDQQRLKQAVTMMVQSKGVTDGPTMSAEEIEERMRVQRNVIESFNEDDSLRKRIEPMQLIAYHLNNFRVNHAYVLPASMRPTAVQRTIPHEHAIDGVPFPSIRDRMILLRGRYDLIEAYQGMLLEMMLRGDDPLDHRNWEFSEKWLHDFPILADEEVYVISNRWRAERGEPPLVRPESRV